MRPRMIIATAAVGVVVSAVTIGLFIGHFSGHPSTPLAVSSATTSTSTTAAASNDPVGWLTQDSGEVLFLQWLASDGKLNGTAQVSATSGDGTQHSVKGGTYDLSGTLDGSKIMISLNRGQPWFGTLAGGALTLNVPQGDGSLLPVRLHRASVAEYNQLVASLHGIANDQNANAATVKAMQAVDGDIAAVLADVNRLSQQRAELPGAIQDVTTAGDGVLKALEATAAERDATIQAAHQHPDGDNGKVCYQASKVSYDASKVDYAVSKVDYYARAVQGDIESIRGQISAIDVDYSKLGQDVTAVPTYAPGTMPTRAQILDAVQRAQTAITDAVANTNGQIDTANNDDVTAYQYAADAYRAGNCGDAASTPDARQHVG